MTNDNPVTTGMPVGPMSLHRWLVGIPVVLFILTLTLFAVYGTEDVGDWLRWALIANVAAVVAGGMVAATGSLELGRIPQAHRARPMALLHGGLNTISLVLLAINLTAHRELLTIAMDFDRAMPRTDPTLAIGLTAGAVAVTATSGVLGFLLAHRYLIGMTPDQLRERGKQKAASVPPPSQADIVAP